MTRLEGVQEYSHCMNGVGDMVTRLRVRRPGGR
jgi:hypothetical protein